MTSRRRPTRRDLLVVVGRLQDLVGSALICHGNNRDPDGFEKGQQVLQEAFDLCTEARSQDPPIEPPSGPWAR